MHDSARSVKKSVEFLAKTSPGGLEEFECEKKPTPAVRFTKAKQRD